MRRLISLMAMLAGAGCGHDPPAPTHLSRWASADALMRALHQAAAPARGGVAHAPWTRSRAGAARTALVAALGAPTAVGAIDKTMLRRDQATVMVRDPFTFALP